MKKLDELIPVGKIIGTHGIKGLVKVYSFSGNAESLKSAETVLLKAGTGFVQEVELNKIALRSGGFILGFKGYDSIEQVQPLIGSELNLRQDQLPEPEENEYYWLDLIGLDVVTDQGDELGKIVDIFETGSSDIYVVQGDGKEYLIPAIADVIANVDISSNKMTITPLDGLLDL
jgi:16S rRNA processing protein RimM